MLIPAKVGQSENEIIYFRLKCYFFLKHLKPFLIHFSLIPVCLESCSCTTTNRLHEAMLTDKDAFYSER